MLALLFRPRLARALWNLFKAMNYVSHVGWDRHSIVELAKHHEKLSKMACEFWHIEHVPIGDPAPIPPSDVLGWHPHYKEIVRELEGAR